MSAYAFTILFSKKIIPLIYAIIGFGVLITIHECGHFLFCKLFNVHTPTFSIGMGPTVFKRKVGDTNFRLALIPIGGYVEIAGMAEVGQGEQKHAKVIGPRSFSTKPYWQRFLILIGGIFFNLLFAYFVFSSLYFFGMPVQKEVELVVKNVSGVSKTADIELEVGDRVLEINGHKLNTDPKLLYPELKKVSTELSEKKDQNIFIKVLRGDEKISLEIPPGENGSNLLRGIVAGAVVDLNTVRVEYEKHSLLESMKKGFITTGGWIGTVFYGIKMLITKRNIKDFGGPIMIVSQSFKFAQRGLLMLFVFLAIISVNLAVINLLPIGALDGGQLLFETIEAIIRRRIPEIIRFSINLASWILILSLILFLSYQDIISIILRRR